MRKQYQNIIIEDRGKTDLITDDKGEIWSKETEQSIHEAYGRKLNTLWTPTMSLHKNVKLQYLDKVSGPFLGSLTNSTRR